MGGESVCAKTLDASSGVELSTLRCSRIVDLAWSEGQRPKNKVLYHDCARNHLPIRRIKNVLFGRFK